MPADFYTNVLDNATFRLYLPGSETSLKDGTILPELVERARKIFADAHTPSKRWGDLSGSSRRAAKSIGGRTPRQILSLFGYKGVAAVSDRQKGRYRRVFGFLDADRDGRHSKREYIDNGVHMNRQARQGIFRASDSNRDGFVSQAEYVENRIITDEAKEIFYKLDTNRDSKLKLNEIVASRRFGDDSLARAVFKALDANGNGELIIPEYLRVWGGWARSGPAPRPAPRK